MHLGLSLSLFVAFSAVACVDSSATDSAPVRSDDSPDSGLSKEDAISVDSSEPATPEAGPAVVEDGGPTSKGEACPAIASASASGSDSAHPPENVLDGDLNTRWSQNGLGSFLTLDLGNTKIVSGVEIAWYLGDTRRAFFDLSVSENGTDFQPTMSGGESSGLTLDYQHSIEDQRRDHGSDGRRPASESILAAVSDGETDPAVRAARLRLADVALKSRF